MLFCPAEEEIMTRTHRLSAWLTAALLVIGLGLAPSLAQAPNDAAMSALAEQARQESESPAAIVMQIREGEVRIGSAGIRASGEDVAVTPDDLWHIGSNTKSMTATLVARLVERGVVNWDDTIAQHLGEHLDGMDPGYAGVTFRHLLSHHSGAPANIGVVHMLRFKLEGTGGRSMPAQRLDFASQIMASPPNSEPGSQFAYSNAGYVIAAAMLEQVTGQSWEMLMAQEVFAPLGITQAGFGAPGSQDVIDQPRGHRPGLLGGLSALTGAAADNPPVLGPAGTVHISMADYARYLQAHIDGARGEASDYLGPDSWEILQTAQFGSSYAMGWGVGGGMLRHSGSNTLWLVQTVIVPDEDVGAVVALNRAHRGSLRPVLVEAMQAE
jgi:D-alanyl-D-alanine carboxypeptidase